MGAHCFVRYQHGYLTLLTIIFVFVFAPAGFGQITLDGSLGPSGALTGPNFVIPADVGQIRGGNLFHSFGLFNVLTGQSATFTGPNSVSNILGRITGGQQSTIDGLLRSEIPGANLYLLNPAGVVFGPNASLDVKGSFHVSTADYLKFADGANFYADLARQSVLTTAPISAFGFLNQNPAGIAIQGSTLQVPQGQALSMIGGAVDVIDSAIQAPGGQVTLASFASSGEVSPSTTAAGPDLSLTGFSRFGNIHVSDSVLGVDGNALSLDPAGTILIRGGQIVVQDSGVNARGNPGGLLRIGAESLDLDTTFVNVGTRGVANHPGTAVDINVSGLVSLHNGSEIASSSSGAGNAGNIQIQAGSIILGDDDPASSPFADSGFYGDIGSRAFSSGRGGDLAITTGSLTVKNGFLANTAALSSGDAGNVTVRADNLTILDGASISSNGLGSGRGGVVVIDVGDALISHANINSVPNCNCFTGVAAQTGFGSPGGAIRINANTLRLLDGGQISSALFSIGPGADIEINAKELVISGVTFSVTAIPSDVHAAIDARLIGSFASGTGGSIRIAADTVEVTNGGFIATSLFADAPGKAGDISINANRIDLSDRGSITASSFLGKGHSGNIVVNADSLVIAGVANSPDPFLTDLTGLSTTTGENSLQGGDIQLNVRNLEVKDKGTVAALTFGPNGAGNINVQASGDLLVTDGGTINSSTRGSGAGGTINITAGTVTIAGAGPFNGPLDAGVSGIASQTATGGGNAGDVRIATPSLMVLNGGTIATDTFGAGRAGGIDITANSIVVSGVNEALKQNLANSGIDPSLAGSHISSGSSRFFLGDAATGDAGNIRISAQNLRLTDGAFISTQTDSAGKGGLVELVADRIIATNGATISSESSGSGNAGDITIQADEFRSENSSVTTQAETADGGNIHLKVASVVELVNSEISAEVKSGVGSGGNITIDPAFVILNDSHITANAFGGPGGNVTIVSDVFLASPESSVTASSALNAQGTVDIQAPVRSLSGTLAPLPEDVFQASSLLREACAPRLSRGQVSSLVAAGREGLPLQPGALMPSPVYRFERHSAPALGQNGSTGTEHSLGSSLEDNSGSETERSAMLAGLSSKRGGSLDFICSKH